MARFSFVDGEGTERVVSSDNIGAARLAVKRYVFDQTESYGAAEVAIRTVAPLADGRHGRSLPMTAATACPSNTAPSGSTLLAQWFNSDRPSDRTHALELWEGANGERIVWEYQRERPSDVWPAPRCMGRNFSRAQAGVLADRLGLDPYLVR